MTKFTRHAYQPGSELNAIGSTIRRIRCAYGWSQNQFATKCQINGWDLDRGIVAKLESRIRAVSDWELLKLCEVLSVTPNEILSVETLPKEEAALLTYLEKRKQKGEIKIV